MKSIAEKNIIQDTIEQGFQASEMRFLSKEPTMYKDLKKEILGNQDISENLKSNISKIIRTSIDVGVKRSLDHGGSFLKELESLRFSNLDDQAEKLSEKRKSLRTEGVQLVTMDEQGDLSLMRLKRRSTNEMTRVNSGDIDMIMHEILGHEAMDGARAHVEKQASSSRNNELPAEPDKDFLFESQEMESRFLTRSSKKVKSPVSNKQMSARERAQENENMDYSDYYDNIFNSFLAYSNAQARGSKINFANHLSATRNQGGYHRRIDVSAGLSQFLRSKIDSFVEDYTKEVVYNKGTVESMFRGMGVLKSEIVRDSEPKLLKLDDDDRKNLILSDLDKIKEKPKEEKKESG